MIRFLQTPGPTKKIVLGILLLLICAAMVITLVPGGLGGSSFGFGTGFGQDVLARVGGKEISVVEAQRTARNLGRQQFPQGVPQMVLPFLMQNATEVLINQHALLAEAQRMGIKVSDAELQDELRHGFLAPQLFPNGNFVGQQEYEDFVSRNDLTIPQFEQIIKDGILQQRLRDMVTGAADVSASDLEQQFRRQNTKVKFQYAVLSSDELKKQIHPGEAELKAYYDRNKQVYTNSIPEKRKVRYVLIDSGKLSAETKATPEQLQTYYKQHQDEYRVSEQVNVRHILIKTPTPGPDGKVDDKAVQAAKQKAEDTLKQLHGGSNFADLAKKYSQDPGSAKNGGSLGFIGRGRTVPEFEQAAFSLPKGGTSGLIKSSYGFHIIHVDDRQDAHLKSLAEVKDQIEPAIVQEQVARQAQALADKVANQARTLGIEKAAAQNGLQVVTTDFVSRNDSLPGIGSSPELMEAIFSAHDKGPPDMTNIKQGYAIFEVTQIKPPATPTFEQARSRVESEFRNERASTLLAQKTQQLSDRAHAQHDLKKAAKEVGATLKTSDLVTPQSQVPDLGAMTGQASIAFTMKPGDISQPINSGSNGIVLMITERQEPSAAEFAKAKDQTRDQLLQQKRNELFALFASNVREQMEKQGKIRINQPLLKQLTTPRSQEGS